MQKFGGVAVIRGIMVLLFAALAATSIASGRVVGGVLFGALAVANVALVVTMHRRRRDLRRRFPQWSGGGPGRSWRDVA
jgi:O-antigen/teichoic acid export membrane protein